jgi:hypothetical protein
MGWQSELDLIDAAFEEATAYGALPVSSAGPVERGDFVADRHGGLIRMGAQVGWSPRREGYEAAIAPGRVAAQPVLGCSECGGLVAVASDRTTRAPSLYAWRSEVDPTCPPLAPEQTCAGCLRQGHLIGNRTRAAAVAAVLAEARRAERGDPWAWTHREPSAEELK